MQDIHKCKEWIEAALEYADDCHRFEDVAQGIREGRFQLWPAARGCMVTEIQVYPQKKVLNVFLAGGELDQLKDMEADMAAWGKAQGCNTATFYGRRGWERVMPHWDRLWVVMRRDL